MFCNSQGKLVAMSGSNANVGSSSKATLSSATASVQSTNSLPSGKWTFVSLVVDCVEGAVDMYVNGRTSGQIKLISSASESAMDGAWSLGDQFSLFGTKSASQCGDNSLRFVVYINMFCLCLVPFDISI